MREEVVGPAGPTTATRMDKFTRTVLEETGLLGMIGKAERGPIAIEAIKDNEAVYLMAVGGAAYLVSQAIKGAKVVGFDDLGMEAIYEFEVEDMPVTVRSIAKANRYTTPTKRVVCALTPLKSDLIPVKADTWCQRPLTGKFVKKEQLLLFLSQ